MKLFAALVTSHNDVLTILEEIPVEELAREFHIIYHSLLETPVWLD